jgi:hypothetical protein
VSIPRNYAITSPSPGPGMWALIRRICGCGAEFYSTTTRGPCEACRKARVCADCGQGGKLARGRCARCARERKRAR